MNDNKSINEEVKNKSDIKYKRKINLKNIIIILLIILVLTLFVVIGHLIFNMGVECDKNIRKNDISSQIISSTNVESTNEDELYEYRKLYLDECLQYAGFPAYFTFDSEDESTNKLMFNYYLDDNGALKNEIKTYVQDENKNILSIVYANINSDGIIFITDDYKVYEYSTSDFEKTVDNIGTVIKAKLKSNNIKNFYLIDEYNDLSEMDEKSGWIINNALKINYKDGKTEEVATWCSIAGTTTMY